VAGEDLEGSLPRLLEKDLGLELNREEENLEDWVVAARGDSVVPLKELPLNLCLPLEGAFVLVVWENLDLDLDLNLVLGADEVVSLELGACLLKLECKSLELSKLLPELLSFSARLLSLISPTSKQRLDLFPSTLPSSSKIIRNT